ncbi:hypothetical protein D3C84_936430 [compost metagenome]
MFKSFRFVHVLTKCNLPQTSFLGQRIKAVSPEAIWVECFGFYKSVHKLYRLITPSIFFNCKFHTIFKLSDQQVKINLVMSNYFYN